ncbi:MAG: hypothetical protein KJ070_08880 [Verrucomicrobia bacterium]|nr:hypothetical protein [Verrucomicrobiota bacterium]
MKQDLPPTPEGAEILQAGGRGGTGNFLYLFPNEQPPVVLKVYRTRRSALNEFLKDFSERHLEGKRGATAATRQATEKLGVDLWTREGLPVVRRVERPIPADFPLPALWFEYCAGPVLWEVLSDRQRTLDTRLTLVEALAQTLSRRHTRAVELNEPLLVHEHGHIKHFFVQGERLLAFDLEHGYRPGYPVIRAVARELSGIACSLVRADQAVADQFLLTLAAGYANRALLERSLAEATHGGGWVGAPQRWFEGKRSSAQSKARVMKRLQESLPRESDRT